MLYGLDVDLKDRNNIIKLHSLIHNQLSPENLINHKLKYNQIVIMILEVMIQNCKIL